MNIVKFSDIELQEIGDNVHLEGTVWRDERTGKTYIVPVTLDTEPDFSDLNFLYLEDHETVELLNRAWVLEARRHSGFRGHLTKCTLVRVSRQVEPKLVWQVFRRDNFSCVYCGEDTGPMTYDHYVPESQGGPTSVENGRTSCRVCNRIKADMLPEDWLQSDALKKQIEYRKKRKNK